MADPPTPESSIDAEIRRRNERRVDLVMDHVRANLDGDLTLTELARVAHFSPHHFHRIFTAVTGETIATFTRRARLERAVRLMRGAPDRRLTSIAAEVGFATPSDFARVFRSRFGQTPSSWDRRSALASLAQLGQGGDDDRHLGWCPTVRVVNRPACRVAYVRVSDPWRPPRLAQAYDRLRAEMSGTVVDGGEPQLIGISWESSKATPPERVTYDLGFTVGADTEIDEGLGIHELPAVRAAEITCRTLRQTGQAWDHLYTEWLPASPYEPDDVPALKRFRHRPSALVPGAWYVDCSIALRPRRP